MHAMTAQQQPQISYDKKEQLDKIASGLLQGEQIYAVFDMKGGGTGFLGITNKRLVIYDKAFLRKMKAIVSIPLNRIQTIAAQDESGLFTGRGFFSSSVLVVTTSHGQHGFEFRGADKAQHAHQLILWLMIGDG
jgi:hypothetical protein